MKTEEEYVDCIIVDAPAPLGPHDDPRKAIWFRVSDVLVDQNVQRTVLAGRIEALTADWDWSLAEGITITVRDDDVLVVTEGQNRVLARQRIAPDSHMWGLISLDSNESKVALGIARGRRPHTPYDKWRLRLHDRDERVLAAEQVLALMDPPLRLFDSAGRTGYGISAVGVVNKIMDTYEDVQASAQLLRSVLRILTKAWPFPTEPRRLDGRLMEALRHLLVHNAEIVDEKRLTEVMQSNTAQRWYQYGSERGAGDTAYSAVGRQICKVYNYAKKTRKLEW